MASKNLYIRVQLKCGYWGTLLARSFILPKMKVKFLCTLSTDSIDIRRDTPKRTEDFSI